MQNNKHFSTDNNYRTQSRLKIKPSELSGFKDRQVVQAFRHGLKLGITVRKRFGQM